MSMPNENPHRDLLGQMDESWKTFMENLDRSMDLLDENLNEVAEMSEACTSEWCAATEHVLDDLANSVFSISEPRWASKEDSDKLKALKRRVHDMYAKFRTVQT